MRGLVQSLTIGELCQNRSGLLALANDQISDRRLLLSLYNKSKYSHTLILHDVDYNYLGPATGSETFAPVFGAS